VEPQVSKVLKIQRLRTRGETIMKTDKINMIINFSILALLIYLAVAVKSLQKEVFWDKSIMKPMVMQNNELRYNVQELLNNVLREAINNQTGEQ
jgi:large-conductance mechanosensitive channel